MLTKIYTIPNISCHHCINTIIAELEEIQGVDSVNGDPSTKEITVSYSPPATPEMIQAALQEINYPPI